MKLRTAFAFIFMVSAVVFFMETRVFAAGAVVVTLVDREDLTGLLFPNSCDGSTITATEGTTKIVIHEVVLPTGSISNIDMLHVQGIGKGTDEHGNPYTIIVQEIVVENDFVGVEPFTFLVRLIPNSPAGTAFRETGHLTFANGDVRVNFDNSVCGN
jgi:hypothetical protein